MRTVSELENASQLRSVADRSSAKNVLLKTELSPNLFIVCVIVACSAGTFALGAARPEPIFVAIVGGFVGAALALGALSFGECLRLRRRLEAVLVLYRDNAA